MKNRLEEPLKGDIGVEDVDNFQMMFIGLFQIGAENRCFSNSSFSGDNDKSLFLLNAVNDGSKRFSIAGGQKEKLRVGRGMKGLFLEMIMTEVHPSCSEFGMILAISPGFRVLIGAAACPIRQQLNEGTILNNEVIRAKDVPKEACLLTI